jgi:hypothetical protein
MQASSDADFEVRDAPTALTVNTLTSDFDFDFKVMRGATGETNGSLTAL